MKPWSPEERGMLLSSPEELHDIVIVGGGLCGLATALALHRKGIKSLVLEKSDKLRAAGALGIYSNAWRALDQLGVGMILRSMAVPIQEIQHVSLHKNFTRVIPCRKEELYWFKRDDLVKVLAENLPKESICFGCQVVAVDKNQESLFSILHMDDGSTIQAKVLIGCDGSNSVIAKSLGLKTPKLHPNYMVRGFTCYPYGHKFCSQFFLQRDANILGRIPINDKLVHWFVDANHLPKDFKFSKDPKLMRDGTIELLKDYPSEAIQMLKHCDLSLLHLSRIRYRAPWNLLLTNLWKGTVTVAGDAMHIMAPFLGQGGGAALEDAVVLARCLAGAMSRSLDGRVTDQEMQKGLETALGKYVKERKLRVLRLSIQTYVLGLILSHSRAKRLIGAVLMKVLFGVYSRSHTQYDCGQL